MPLFLEIIGEKLGNWNVKSLLYAQQSALDNSITDISKYFLISKNIVRTDLLFLLTF